VVEAGHLGRALTHLNHDGYDDSYEEDIASYEARGPPRTRFNLQFVNLWQVHKPTSQRTLGQLLLEHQAVSKPLAEARISISSDLTVRMAGVNNRRGTSESVLLSFEPVR